MRPSLACWHAQDTMRLPTGERREGQAGSIVRESDDILYCAVSPSQPEHMQAGEDNPRLGDFPRTGTAGREECHLVMIHGISGRPNKPHLARRRENSRLMKKQGVTRLRPKRICSHHAWDDGTRPGFVRKDAKTHRIIRLGRHQCRLAGYEEN